MIRWKDIFNEIKKYKREIILGNVIAVIAVIISTPIPLLIPLLVDEVLLNKPGFLTQTIDRFFDYKTPFFYVVVVLIITILLRFLFFILNVAQSILFTRISKNITYKIREQLLNHIKKVSMSEFDTIGSGRITSHFVTDVNTIDTFLGVSVSRLIISLLTIIGVAVVLLWIHWQLALFILLLNPIVIYFTMVLGRKVGKLKRKENKATEIFQEALSETLDLFWQIRASNREESFISNVINKAKTLRDTSIAFGWKSDAATRFSFLVFLTGYEVFRAASILFVAYSDLSIGLMLAIFAYLWVMMTPVQEILGIQYAFHSADAALKRINELLDMEKEPEYPHILNPFKNKKTTSIKLQDVNFSYPDGKKVLHDINMNISEAQKVAIVGASGSGKTTLAHILVGFYPVKEGKIYYGGIPVEKIGLDVVRDNVSLVLQMPMTFNDTIRFNLTLGRDIPEEEIWRALKIAQLKDVVEQMPKKLDTLVGKNGIRLSGGQRQRLAIARMILENPKIVIFDESTSALDTQTEFNLFKELEHFLKDKTTIIIAHRLSTIRQADYIYVLDKGRVVEEGNYDKLILEEGLFNKFMEKEIKNAGGG